MKNLYEILGVKSNANSSEIRSAYRKLVKQHHPDSHSKSSQDSALFQQITNAYFTLSHADKRSSYDAAISKQQLPGLSFNFRELKNWIFSSGIIRSFLKSKIITKQANSIDPSILELPEEELLKQVVYSGNNRVKLHAMRALIYKNPLSHTGDLFRLLYSGIDHSVKREIVQYLSSVKDSEIQEHLQEYRSFTFKSQIEGFLDSFDKAE